jgi:hypothetical protein
LSALSSRLPREERVDLLTLALLTNRVPADIGHLIRSPVKTQWLRHAQCF